MAIDMILFPSGYFDPGKVDEDLQMEYEAVLSTGLFEVGIFGYDKWFNEGKLVLRAATGCGVKAGETKQEKTAVYRGWMMKPNQYEKFFQSLLERNVRLITEPDSYWGTCGRVLESIGGRGRKCVRFVRRPGCGAFFQDTVLLFLLKTLTLPLSVTGVSAHIILPASKSPQTNPGFCKDQNQDHSNSLQANG